MITIKSLKWATTTEIHKMDQALALANRVWTEQAFWDGVYASKFNDADGPQVVSALKRAITALDLYVYSQPWYKRWSSETAVENSNGSIGFERRYFSRASLTELVNTLAHEISHRAGFSHDWKATARRSLSVPYLVGSIAENFAHALSNAVPPCAIPSPLLVSRSGESHEKSHC